MKVEFGARFSPELRGPTSRVQQRGLGSHSAGAVDGVHKCDGSRCAATSSRPYIEGAVERKPQGRGRGRMYLSSVDQIQI